MSTCMYVTGSLVHVQPAHFSIIRTPDMAEFTIDADTRIQILDQLPHLARARKHQYAAFIRDEGVLCVWADAVESIVKTTEDLEQSLIDYIWHQENAFKKQGFAAHLEAHAQQEKLLANRALPTVNDEGVDSATAEACSVLDPEDLALSEARRHWKARPVMLYDALSTGITGIITIALLALGWRESKGSGSQCQLLLMRAFVSSQARLSRDICWMAMRRGFFLYSRVLSLPASLW
jgi:hypothetical protein